MAKSEISSGALRMVSIGQLSIIILLAAVSISWALPEETATKAKCQFTKFLENPDNRIRYENTLEKARFGYAETNNYDNAAMYGLIAKGNSGLENGDNLDSFSAGCLSCHDGKTASNVRPNLKNSPDKKSVMLMISGKHPIGMDYQKYSVNQHNLKSLDEMSKELVLVEGRVSCITCHDPLNSGQNHQTITRSGVDLCSACHNV
jgi:predicted CXXCH cytochrome family protein